MKTTVNPENIGTAVINNGDLPVEIYRSPGAPQKPRLTPAKRKLLERCEVVIHRGMVYVFKVGAALRIIQKKKLYLDDYDSFEEYSEGRWKIHRSLAYRWIAAARVWKVLSPIGDTVPMPSSEYQVRALSRANLSPADARQVWKDAVASSSGGKVTGKVVAEKVAALRAIRGEHDEQPAVPSKPAVKVDRATVGTWYRQVVHALRAVEHRDTEYAAELLGDLEQRLLEVTACRIMFCEPCGPADYEI